MVNTNILGLIKSLLNELPKAELRVAMFILEQPRDVLNMTAQELGKASKASAATVVRLSKRLEIDSFPQMKLMLMKELDNGVIKGYSDISANEPLVDIKNKLLGNAYQSLSDTASLLDNELIEEAVHTMEKAKIIYIYGVGSSHLVAENLAQKWSRIGKTCISMEDTHSLIAAMISNSEDKLFIGISNSGRTSEVVQLMKIANNNHCNTMSITQFGKNPVMDAATINLQHVRVNEQAYRSAATASLHVQFYLIDVLFHAYASKNFETIINHVVASREEISMYSNK